MERIVTEVTPYTREVEGVESRHRQYRRRRDALAAAERLNQQHPFSNFRVVREERRTPREFMSPRVEVRWVLTSRSIKRS